MDDSNCRELIEGLLGQTGESRSVDYKGPMNFPAKNTDERAEIIRDVLAFSNSKDGGYMVIGVDDTTKKPGGMTLIQAKTWDITDIRNALTSTTSPAPVIDVCQEAFPDGVVVAIRIREFGEDPHLSTWERKHTTKGTVILREAGLYVRTEGAQSVEVNNVELMRELLGRAYVKKGERFLREAKALIDAHWPGKEPEAEDLYGVQIRRDFEEMTWP